MGYRSIVRMITTPIGWEFIAKMYPFYLKKRMEQSNIGGFDLLECLSYLRQDETGVYFGWDDIKWYDEYFPEIIAMTDTLIMLEDKDIPFQFIRVGEDDTDIVHLYHLGDSDVEPFYVHTEIRGGR